MSSQYLPLEIESRPTQTLIPYARNARTHSEAQVAQIAGSIAEFGFLNPVLIDADGGIIAGHGRVLAARLLHREEVPVIVLGHLTENQKRAFMLADNRIALNAGWDEEMLRLELEALAAEDCNLDVLGFDERELQELIESERQILQDEVTALEAKVVTRPGDLWILGDHRLLCGDGTRPQELSSVLEGQLSHMVFTDPPYNVAYTGKTARQMKIVNDDLGTDFSDFLARACRAMLGACQGALYLCMSSGELHRLYAAFTEAGGHWSTFLIWAKNTFTLGRSDYQRQYEPILYGWSEGHKHYWCGDRDQGDVWAIDKPHANDLHPTMKPVELVERAITNSSKQGNLVLDPFAGSGSTVIACENLNRKARVIELDPAYADVIVRRWQTYTDRSASLDRDGRCFDDIAPERTAQAEGQDQETLA